MPDSIRKRAHRLYAETKPLYDKEMHTPLCNIDWVKIENYRSQFNEVIALLKIPTSLNADDFRVMAHCYFDFIGPDASEEDTNKNLTNAIDCLNHIPTKKRSPEDNNFLAKLCNFMGSRKSYENIVVATNYYHAAREAYEAAGNTKGREESILKMNEGLDRFFKQAAQKENRCQPDLASVVAPSAPSNRQ